MDYTRDIEEIRTMMERSTKFPSLSGWAGIMAGIYALAGSYVAYAIVDFHPEAIYDSITDPVILFTMMQKVVIVAIIVLISAIATALYFTQKKAGTTGERVWNATSRRLLINLAVPLIAGGFLIAILIYHGLLGLIAPTSLLFYGLALYGAGKYTYDEVTTLGLIQIVLGLIGTFFVEYGVLMWAIGFGGVHIAYGIFMQYKYERDVAKQ
jgi:hypothetical protein